MRPLTKWRPCQGKRGIWALNENADRQFVTALARGLNILSCFRDADGPLSVQEVAARTGLARPTVARLTYTLVESGYLHREPSGGYRPAAKVLELGFTAIRGSGVISRFQQTASTLCSGPNPYVTVALAERSGTRAVYLSVRSKRQAVSATMEVGARLPLFYTAAGRAILAGLDPTAREEVFRASLTEFPQFAERMQQGLQLALKDNAAYGYCTSFGSWKPEINAIAVPLAGLAGVAGHAVNVGGPSFLVSQQELHEVYGPMLLEAQRELLAP